MGEVIENETDEQRQLEMALANSIGGGASSNPPQAQAQSQV